jgi:hypothetical protein
VGAALKQASAKVREAKKKVTDAQADVSSKETKVCANIDAGCARRGNCKTTKEECKEYGKKMQCDKTEQQCTGGWSDVCTKTTKSCTKKLPSWLGWACKGWSTVCSETSKVCNGWGAVCTASREVVDFSNCKVRDVVCTSYETVVDGVCKAACETAAAGLRTAVGTMEAAKGVLTGTEKTLGALAKAADVIGDNFAQIFNIKRAGFRLTLNASTQKISVEFNAVVMGSNLDFSYELNFHDLAASAAYITNLVQDKIKSMS